MSNRAPLTTKTKKAKCLNYRQGKRCGRLGRYLVNGTSQRTGQPYRYPVCAECKASLVEAGGRLRGCSLKGYTVRFSLFGPIARAYTPIEPTCASCGATPQSPADAYCHPCGVEVTDCEELEMLFYAADNEGEDRFGNDGERPQGRFYS